MVQIITIHITYAQLNKAAAVLLVPSALEPLARGILQPQLPHHHLIASVFPSQVSTACDSFTLCQHQSHPKFIQVTLSELVCDQFMWEPTSALPNQPLLHLPLPWPEYLHLLHTLQQQTCC